MIRRKTREQGSVMLETALVMPLFLVIVLGLIQLAYLLLGIQMTRYAAYCAARAALVYNPQEQAAKAQQAAYTVLSWVAFSVDPSGRALPLGSSGKSVPVSGGIEQRVRITELTDTADAEKSSTMPMVKATVTFDFNLLIPFANVLVGAIFGGGDVPDGVIPWAASGSSGKSGDYDRYYKSRSRIYQVPVTASYVMAKPYSTKSFPLTK